MDFVAFSLKAISFSGLYLPFSVPYILKTYVSGRDLQTWLHFYPLSYTGLGHEMDSMPLFYIAMSLVTRVIKVAVRMCFLN